MMSIQRQYLEYFVADHCNLRCAHCSHFSPHLRAGGPALASFEKDLEALREVMRVDSFRFLGGEPLLNRSLPAYIDSLRQSGLAREIGLCTNGLLLHKTDPRVWEMLDSLHVSIYPDCIPNPQRIKTRAEQIAERFRLQVCIDYKPVFRFQNLSRPIASGVTVQSIYSACMIAHGGYDDLHDGCHTFYNGMYFKCSRPVYTLQYLKTLGCDTEQLPDFTHLDGVPLHEADLAQRLVDYLGDSNALASCRWCLGTSGIRISHQLLSREEALRPVPESLDPNELIDYAQMAQDDLTIKKARAGRGTRRVEGSGATRACTRHRNTGNTARR